MKNSDDRDLALSAKVTASSSAKGMTAAKAIDGWNRVVGKDRSAWSPDPKARGPHWLQLQLPKAEAVDTVHVTAEKRSADFRVQAWVDGGWKTLAQAPAEKARRVVLHFAPVRTERVRIIADRNPQALVLCEVRLYHERARGTK